MRTLSACRPSDRVPSVEALQSELHQIVDTEPPTPIAALFRLPANFLEAMETLTTIGVFDFDPHRDLSTAFEGSGWELERALRALRVSLVPFRWDRTIGGGQSHGYSYDRSVAISPIASDPQRLVMHELGHVLLHLTPSRRYARLATASAQAGTPPDLQVVECEAEAVSLVCTQALGYQTIAHHAYYLWSYAEAHGAELFSADRVKRIRAAATRILKAGEERS